ncbi:uncharacterized protein LOC142352232 isoform X1 [Convolutriloba macropyga]|uniref:uncharacterized protein LOC142352232 isoform X1 n=1 Tax=Convolutriloba macropyga TaxID=536237 RepID=UPI003F525032
MASTFPSVADVCRACADGDLTLLKILISRKAPVDSLCQPVYVRGGKHLISGWPPVRVAARYAQYRVLQLLLSLDSVEPNKTSLDDGRTALHDAVELGNLLIVDMLLKAGSNPLMRDFRSQNCLDIARTERNTTVLEILLESVSNPVKSTSFYPTGTPTYTGGKSPLLGGGFGGESDVGADSEPGVRLGGYTPITTLSSEIGWRPPLRNNWMSENSEGKEPNASLDEIVFETNLRESPFYTGLISQLTELQLENQLLHHSSQPNTTTTPNQKYGPISRRQFTKKEATGEQSSQEKEMAELKKQIGDLQDNMRAVWQRLSMSIGGEPTPAVAPVPEIPKPVLLMNSKYLARYPVPQDKKDWSVEFTGYAPIMYSAEELYTMGRSNDKQKEALMTRVKAEGGYEARMLYYPPVWADPEILGMSPKDKETFFKFNQRAMVPYHPLHQPKNGPKEQEVNRVSYLGQYLLDPSSGAPLNPAGRTGMIGRGLLGKYGPNHAADPVVSCFSSDTSTKTLELALIQRRDTKQFAFPGGMVDPGENELSGTAVREFCEEAVEGDNQAALSPEEKKKRRKEMITRFTQHKVMKQPIISKVVDDPRNTDNAWMETQAFWFHFNSEADLGRKLQAGDDAQKAQWVKLDDNFDINSLYADHGSIVIKLFQVILENQMQSKDFEGLTVPKSIQEKLNVDC